MKEDSGLSHLGLTQVLIGAFKHQVGDAESKNLVSLLKHLLSHGVVVIQVFAHTYKLGTLTGKYNCFHIG